jgi:hypothetical protein
LALERSQLIEAWVFLLLLLDVLSDGGFVVSHRGDPVAACPEVLPHKIPSLPSLGPRNGDGTLAFQIPHYLRDRVLRRTGDQLMHMIDHQVPFPKLGRVSAVASTALRIRWRRLASGWAWPPAKAKRIGPYWRSSQSVVLAVMSAVSGANWKDDQAATMEKARARSLLVPHEKRVAGLPVI